MKNNYTTIKQKFLSSFLWTKILSLPLKPLFYMQKVSEEEEKAIIENMPKWYYYYQYHILSKGVRFISLILVASVWYIDVIVEILHQYLNINKKYLIFVYTEEFMIFHWTLIISAILFLASHCVFHVIIRVVLFKKICKNSPWSIVKCISVGMKACLYTSSAVGVFFGVPGTDWVFERNGFVAPMRWFYAERQVRLFGYNETSCGISDGEIVQGGGLVSQIIRKGQIKTGEVEIKLNKEYLEIKEKLPPKETIKTYFNK